MSLCLMSPEVAAVLAMDPKGQRIENLTALVEEMDAEQLSTMARKDLAQADKIIVYGKLRLKGEQVPRKRGAGNFQRFRIAKT